MFSGCNGTAGKATKRRGPRNNARAIQSPGLPLLQRDQGRALRRCHLHPGQVPGGPQQERADSNASHRVPQKCAHDRDRLNRFFQFSSSLLFDLSEYSFKFVRSRLIWILWGINVSDFLNNRVDLSRIKGLYVQGFFFFIVWHDASPRQSLFDSNRQPVL